MSEEVKTLIEKLGTTIAEYKQENDRRLKEIEKNGAANVLTEEKLAKMDDAIDKFEDLKTKFEEIEKKANRPGTSPADEKKELQEQYKSGFINGFVRKGKDTSELRELERKAVNVTTPGDGGYAIPEQLDLNLIQRLRDANPIRALASQITVSNEDYSKLVNLGGTASGWVDEDDARSATNSSTIAKIAAVMGEIYANPPSTQTALDDMAIDVESWIMDEIEKEFVYQEGVAFLTGNGTKKPKGILAYTTAATADGSRTFGQIEHVATGVSGGWPVADSDTIDKLIDLQDALAEQYLPNARFILNRRTLSKIRKLKDSEDNLIWQMGMSAGDPATILGAPYTKLAGMPNVAADSLSVGFGDIKAAYLVVDRMGMRLLRDPYTNKPYVHFYTTKRVGGMLIEDRAIKLLKFATS